MNELQLILATLAFNSYELGPVNFNIIQTSDAATSQLHIQIKLQSSIW